MIEVLFGESEAGAMKVAKNKIVIGKVDGPTSVFMAGKKKPPEKPFCGWIEGRRTERMTDSLDAYHRAVEDYIALH